MSGKRDKCCECNRGETYFEGCSFIECPKRKPITAQTSQISQDADSLIAYSESGCSMKIPTDKE